MIGDDDFWNLETEPLWLPLCNRARGCYNGVMDRENRGMASRSLRKVKNFLLLLLFLVIPFAGVFHPKIRRREDPDEKEIGDKV